MNESRVFPRIRLSIQSRLDHVFLVGKSAWALSRYAGFGESEADSIELCLVEAVTNAIQHGYRGEKDHSVDIDIILFSDRISLVVSHGGQGPLHVPKEPSEVDITDARSLPESGMGLSIIRRVMDHMTYATHGNVHVWTMEKRRSDE
ncbi:MAG: ATP-binding protein [Desulfobacteraceae bacterium]|jgi:serine/threonine-protein kinase RsbW|nr:ATP-binding protein [Desulfobacteraceae bacterium]